VVRYEDLQRDPAPLIRRIWAHWGVELSDADVAAGMAVASRTAVQACQDPAYGEDVAPARAVREAFAWGEREAAVLNARLAGHLHHAFGYAAAPEAAPEEARGAREPAVA
jgi:hypothetical protein